MAAQAQNVPLGLGTLYFKRTGDSDGKYRMVGALKGAVELTYKREFVEAKVGDMLGKIRRDVVDEDVMLKATICDFKVEQLIAFLGVSLSTTQLTATQSIRVKEQHVTGISTTDTQTLSATPISITSVHATSLDRATNFVRGTDYTQPTARGLKPISAAFKNTTVLAHYTKRVSTVRRLRMGDSSVLQEVSVRFVHKLSSGKYITVDIPRATIQGDLVIPWNEKEYTTKDITFAGLADPTLPSGRRLFTIAREH